MKVSEFAGSARCFCGALIVNPYSKSEVSSALHEALTMPDDEKAEKHKSNWNYVRSHTYVSFFFFSFLSFFSSFFVNDCFCRCFVWADAFLSDLAGSTRPLQASPLPRLDFTAVKTGFREASKRVFIINHFDKSIFVLFINCYYFSCCYWIMMERSRQ